jgi:hypothetical protein
MCLQAEELERELFGGAADLLQQLENDAVHDSHDGAGSIGTYVRDISAVEGVQEQHQISSSRRQSKPDVGGKQGRRPVWVDDDDEDLRVNIAAEPKLRKLRKTDKEAVLAGERFSV